MTINCAIQRKAFDCGVVRHTINMRYGRQVVIDGGTDKNYVKSFVNVESVIVEHNLNKYPSVFIIDTADTVYLGEVVYDSLNQCTVSWTGLMTGKIVCN